jgi:hypothetical protein
MIAMFARILAVLVLPAIAGCATAVPTAEPSIPGLAVAARTIGPADYVEVTATHRSAYHRLERIALVAPGGREIPPAETHADTTRRIGAGPWPVGTVGIAGGNRGVGVGVGFPLVIGEGGWSSTVRTLRATFKIPDPAAYRADPAAWQIVLHWRDGHGLPIATSRPAPAAGP